MIEAKLTKSNLSEADLRRADMTRGDFSGSIFNDSSLVSVTAKDTNFSGSHFVNARAHHINLEGANLTDTLLRDVKFGTAVFERTILKDADLSGADFRDVTGLTQTQLDTACGDYKTRLPTGMSIAYCTHDLNTTAEHASNHRQGEHPPHINRAAEDLDDALQSIESMLAGVETTQDRKKLQAIHADVMAAREALER